MKLPDRMLTYGGWLAALLVAAVPAMADSALTVTPGPHGTTLVLDGATPFHTTTDIVVDAGVIEIPGSLGAAVIWTEATPDGGETHHYAITLDGWSFSQVFETSNQIELVYAQFDPLVETPAVPAELEAGPDNNMYLVQFHTQPLEAFQDAVAVTGAELFAYYPQNTLAVRMSPEQVLEVASLPFVRWVGPVHPAYKLDPAILTELAQSDSGELKDYSVMVFGRGLAQQQPVVDYIDFSGVGSVMNVGPETFRMTITVDLAQVVAIAQLSEVQFIDPWGPGETDMDNVRKIGGVEPTLRAAGFYGEGVRGEVHDTGVYTGHPEWSKPPLWHKTVIQSSHGTACYGINFAQGKVAKAEGLESKHGHDGQGIAFNYRLSTQFGGPYTRLSLNREATNPKDVFKSVWQTSSVGSPRTYTYTTISAETDDYLFQVDYLSCQSMSNAGLIPDTRPQAWAKNIVGVGGVMHYDNLTRTVHKSTASTGYGSDMRIKPDLTHFYDQIYTTYSSTGYGQFGGTSGATPCTVGHFGLLMQMWHEKVFPGFGGGASVFADRPKSTTAKALMINTAYRYNWKVGGSNANMWRNRQGWGMADLGNLYANRNKLFIIDETDILKPLEKRTYELTVPAGEHEFAATLVYIDVQGNPAVQTQHRVNDLSLRVISPRGTSYWGNNGMWDTNSGQYGGPDGDNWTAPGGSRDVKNTTENVFLQNPEAGKWKVIISGDEITKDTHVETPALDADYGLVVRGVIAPAPGCRGDFNCDGVRNFRDIDAFVEALSTQVCKCPNFVNCDPNGDGVIDFKDIDPFIPLLGVPCP